jgi:hypothetical protein
MYGISVGLTVPVGFSVVHKGLLRNLATYLEFVPLDLSKFSHL